MIGLASHVRIYLACGVTDMRKGFDTLAAQVQTMLSLNPRDRPRSPRTARSRCRWLRP